MNCKNRIKEFRLKASLSQAQLANHVSLNHRTISSYENGSRAPDLETIKKLAQALKCKPADLFPVLKG